MKRGVSAPFVWIFALVAGAIVMIFLISFAFRHVDIQETKFSFQDLNNFEINLDLLSQSKSLTTKIQLPEIEFPCIENTQFIKTGPASKPTDKIIFSKNQQSTTTIKTKQFNFPYPITNIYFFASKNYPDQSLDQNLLPNQIYYQDLSQAECIKQRLINKINTISTIYMKKAGILLKDNPECRDFYKEIINQINQHKNPPTKEKANKIDELNQELNLNNCPTLW